MTSNEKTFYVKLAVTVAVVVLLMVVAKALFFSGGDRTSMSNVAQNAVTPTGDTKIISWQDATKHYGETRTVEGKVVATHNSGKACFLNFHSDWRRSFSAVIFASRFDAFPPEPEEHYRGKTVRVTGLIQEYQGKPEIVLESPDQIEVIR